MLRPYFTRSKGFNDQNVGQKLKKANQAQGDTQTSLVQNISKQDGCEANSQKNKERGTYGHAKNQ